VADTLQDPSGQSLEAAPSDLARVFHRLNNQLGVILANAELLESRLVDDTQRARAGQVVGGALEAIAAVQDLRRLVSASGPLPR
jgi:signal transduction histidine kinase